MKLITRDIDYSIRVLKYLVKCKNYFTVTNKIAKDLKIPNAFLKKITKYLSKNDILISYKGKGGGIKLNKDPKTINIMNIIRVFHGEFKLIECKFLGSSCQKQTFCKLRKILISIESEIKNKLTKTKLTDII